VQVVRSIQNSKLSVKVFNVFRKDIDKFGGPCKLKQNLIYYDIEAIWVEVHVPNMKPVLVGCCYRPPDAHVDYLTCLGEMLDNVSDVNWLNLTGIKEKDCLFLIDSPISPSGLFGDDSVRKCFQRNVRCSVVSGCHSGRGTSNIPSRGSIKVNFK